LIAQVTFRALFYQFSLLALVLSLSIFFILSMDTLKYS